MNDCINIKNTCFRHRIAGSRSCYFWNLFLTLDIIHFPMNFLYLQFEQPAVSRRISYTVYIACKLRLARCKRNIIHKVLSTKVMQVWRGDLFSKRNTTLILHRACFIFISISHYFFSFLRYNFILYLPRMVSIKYIFLQFFYNTPSNLWRCYCRYTQTCV